MTWYRRAIQWLQTYVDQLFKNKLHNVKGTASAQICRFHFVWASLAFPYISERSEKRQYKSTVVCPMQGPIIFATPALKSRGFSLPSPPRCIRPPPKVNRIMVTLSLYRSSKLNCWITGIIWQGSCIRENMIIIFSSCFWGNAGLQPAWDCVNVQIK